MKRKPPAPPRKKQRGGQPGPRKACRALVPPQRVSATIPCKPSPCRRCGPELSGADPEPLIHQIAIGLLIALRPLLPIASTVGSGLAAIMLLTTLTFLVTTPGWEPSLGGIPALSTVTGQFVLKDVVLLGVALSSAGEALGATRPRQTKRLIN